MPSLEDYTAFVAILDQGSLTAAARHLGRSLQSVSRALQALEQDLGVELVIRTTRRLRPTEAGLAFHGRIRTALADIAFARDELAANGAKLAGRIRVGASTQFGPQYVLPALTAFMERHPDIEIDLALNDSAVDLITSGIDVAVRIGVMDDSSLRARRIGAVRRVAFAAPGYLARRGRPACPADLAGHECVLRRTAMATETWVFGEGERQERVEVAGRLRSDSPVARNEAVAAGFGVGIAPLYQVHGLLAASRVELILTEFETPAIPVQILWPPGPAMPNRTRALVDFLAARLSVLGI